MTNLIYLCYVVFILSSTILIWTYLIYPLLVAILARGRELSRDVSFKPFLSVIIPAHDEERIIKEKIQNTLSLSYPKEKLEIIVVDDASIDKTAEILSQFDEIKTVRLQEREGKSKAIEAGLKLASGDFVLLTDADCFLNSESLSHAVENFGEKEVGAVTGALHFFGSKSSSISVHSSGRENWLGIYESLLDSVPTGLGSFLAVKKSLIQQMDSLSTADDVYISTHVRSQGYRVLYDPRVIANTWSPSVKPWFKLSTRRTLQGLATLFRQKSMLFNPRYGWYGMMILPTRLLFHRLTPFLLITSFACLTVINPPISLMLATASLLSAALIPIARKFFLVQIIFILAWAKFLSGKYEIIWERGPRP